MEAYRVADAGERKKQYVLLCSQAESLTDGETNVIANLANLSALLNLSLPDINWAGFYLREEDELVLGPFQGKPACIRIPMGKGVCGTAAQKDEIQVVRDVHLFPGHIACDSCSASEIVVPLHRGDRVTGVLDIDSPFPARFDETDARGLKALAPIIEAACFRSGV